MILYETRPPRTMYNWWASATNQFVLPGCMQRSSTYGNVLTKLIPSLQPTVCRTELDPQYIGRSPIFLLSFPLSSESKACRDPGSGHTFLCNDPRAIEVGVLTTSCRSACTVVPSCRVYRRETSRYINRVLAAIACFHNDHTPERLTRRPVGD